MKAVFDWMLTVGSALSQLAYAVFANSRNSNLSISGTVNGPMRMT